MLKGGISQPRNKGLFKMFNLIGLGEHAGSGVPDIYKAWRDAGLKEPEVEELFGSGNPDRTVLTLPLVATSHSSITSEGVSEGAGEEAGIYKRVIEFCGIERTKAEIQDFCKIKSDRYIRQRVIQPLLSKGELRRTIPDKPSSPKQKYITTKTERERAQAIMDNNPVLACSPGDLRREGREIEEYLSTFSTEEQGRYKDYYEDEL